MPKCGSQIILCDLPIRFDTYQGCQHGCKYCFAARSCDISKITTAQGAVTLENYIKGKRDSETSWCDWDIPLHWGGMSDPFQPIEEKLCKSYKCLEVFAKYQYPFVFSTKGKLAAHPKYLDLIGKCNCAAQISMICKGMQEFEPQAPTFEERLEMAKQLIPNVHRLIIRVQPYMPQFKNEILDVLQTYKDIGVYGITIESLKLFKKKGLFTCRIGADYCLPVHSLKKDFEEIRRECHSIGLKFFCAENRLRYMGDSLCCCGVDGIDGWMSSVKSFFFQRQL